MRRESKEEEEEILLGRQLRRDSMRLDRSACGLRRSRRNGKEGGTMPVTDLSVVFSLKLTRPPARMYSLHAVDDTSV